MAVTCIFTKAKNRLSLAEYARFVCAVALVGLLVSEYRDFQIGRYIYKPLASTAFVVATFANRAASSQYLWVLGAALVFSAIGDVLLIPKSVAVFRAGIGIFALAHVLFIAAFFVRGIDFLAAGIALVPLAVFGVVVARALIPHVDAELRGAVIGYSAILTLMLSAAIGTYTKQHSTILLSAAVLFYLSDLMVAQDKFIREAFVNRLFGLPMYYAAQLLFAATAAIGV